MAPNAYDAYFIPKFVLLKPNSYVLYLIHALNFSFISTQYIAQFALQFDSDPLHVYQSLIICNILA